MKAKQSGGPTSLVHRCFVAYGPAVLVFLSAAVAAETRPPDARPSEARPSEARPSEARPSEARPSEARPSEARPSEARPSEARPSAKSLEDYAQVYVNQYFEPGANLTLPEEARRKSKALAHYAIGRSFESQGKPQEAVDAYSEVLRNQPDQFFLARKTAYLLARSGRQEEALKLLEESLQRNPDEPYAHIALSEFLATYQGGDATGLQRSFDVIEKAVARFPDEPAVYEHLVKLFLSSDRADDARRIVSEAAKRDNRDPEFWLRLGRIAVRVWPVGEGGEIADSDLANTIHAKALQFAGGDVSVAERVGDYYHATGQFDLAVAVYSPLIQAHADRIDLRQKLAQVFAAKGDEAHLIETLKEIVEIDSENADAHKQLAGIFLRAERYKEAIPHFRAALSITKGSVAEYGALGRMMIEADESEVAVDFLEDAAYLFPDSPDFPLFLTFALAKLERWGEAVKQFEKTLALAKDDQPQLLNETFYFRYAAAHERLGDFAKAEELFRKTIELIAKNDPDDENQEFTATVYNYLGYMWLENDVKIDEAGELIKTAAELDPESGAIADSLGWFHFKKGQFESARDELLRAQELIENGENPVGPGDAEIYDHIGQVFEKLGDRAKAVEYLEKAVALDPEREESKKRLEEYKAAKPVPPPGADKGKADGAG